MSETLPDVPLSNIEYTSLNSETSIPVGTKSSILNKGNSWVRIIESATKPSNDSEDGWLLSSFPSPKSSICVASGSLEIWAKITTSTSGSVSFQER